VGERGQSLVEAIVAVAVASVVVSAVLGAAIVANAHFGANPAQSALAGTVRREMDVARNLAKYQGASLQPRTVQTTAPLPDGSPLPASLSLSVAAQPSGALQVTISASATWRGTPYTYAMTSALLAPAPLPGSTVPLEGLVPAPTGAP
jgi:hypothetical protein